MHPPLFVNSDAFVNTARMHAHVLLECAWYDSHQHWWCVQFERRAALLSVRTPFHQSMRCSHSPLCLQTPTASCLHAMFTLTFVFPNTHGPRQDSGTRLGLVHVVADSITNRVAKYRQLKWIGRFAERWAPPQRGSSLHHHCSRSPWSGCDRSLPAPTTSYRAGQERAGRFSRGV